MNDMKIAFTTRGTQWDSRMDPRFGRTEFLLVYDPENDELLSFDNRTIENEARGAGPKTSRMLHELGAEVLVTGNGPGEKAVPVLERLGIRIFTGAGEMTVREAYRAYRDDQLAEF